MISDNTFTKEWIQRKSLDYKQGKRKADPGLIEKVIIAIHLLESLAQTDLKFIFKGGTSLLMLLNEMHRFSIDIDIIVESEKDGDLIEKILLLLVKQSKIFTRFEENARNSNMEIPKAHYKLFYMSVINEEESHILLDILYEKSHYSDVIKKSIDCGIIECEGSEVYVNVPSVDCILGDKLTAFAPNTTGIPYGKNKELEIIKQLFDVGNLFDEIDDISLVAKTFEKVARQELVYRKMDKTITREEVLDDIFKTSKIISERGFIDKDIFVQLEKGITRIRGYIFSKNYIIESAINSASKAAYLSQLLKYGISDIERFDPKLNLKEYIIKHPDFLRFKSILKYDPEAYFYWYKAIEIINTKSLYM